MTEATSLQHQIEAFIAGRSLDLIPSGIAKLYSQMVRVKTGQDGLGSWQRKDEQELEAEAFLLADAGIEARTLGLVQWNSLLRRSGEIFEWLSLVVSDRNERETYVTACACCYQLGGFPARASGVLISSDSVSSDILADFISGRFAPLLARMPKIINSRSSALSDGDQIIQSLWRTISLLCAEMRWPEGDARYERIEPKFSAFSQLMQYQRDGYSALLARLLREIAIGFRENNLRKVCAKLTDGLPELHRNHFERYFRRAFLNSRTIAWPSQIRGIKALAEQNQVILCTPTGAGKTLIAELAILKEMLSNPETPDDAVTLYLTPSRTLCAEVERKLSDTFHSVSLGALRITGLYGGADWGPTDAWLTTESKIVLVCTYEKAEALVRFLGPLFMRRVRLLVIDEAHSVETNESIITSESRALRLEVLLSRLFTYLDSQPHRVVALSAVTQNRASLANWISNGEHEAFGSEQRNMRQLIGQMTCANQYSDFYYDLLDGHSIKTADGVVPYVYRPFPRMPRATGYEGPRKALRPYVFWAAMHLAGNATTPASVLISLNDRPEDYCESFIDLLEEQWKEESLPNFFSLREDMRVQHEQCLSMVLDYFGADSQELRLLRRGIVVHHGRMPSALGAALVEGIEAKLYRVVLATSTLSEGINLPFETILLPTVVRGKSGALSVREFLNLAGRAGRPGTGTEGRTLVAVPAGGSSYDRGQYNTLLQNILEQPSPELTGQEISGLATLLKTIFELWTKASDRSDESSFYAWLETAGSPEVPVQGPENLAEQVDTLDGILLSVIAELEGMTAESLSPAQIEERLASVWAHSYAKVASLEEERLRSIFLRRGTALPANIYTNAAERTELYKTGLPPRQAKNLIALIPTIERVFAEGANYVGWSSEERISWIKSIISALGQHTFFCVEQRRPRSQIPDWEKVLNWWLTAGHLEPFPEPKKIGRWHKYVSRNFGYKFNWALGSCLALIFQRHQLTTVEPLSFETWPQSGLPWSVFWLKEMMVWGTTEPVASYLLALGAKKTRREAEDLASIYYANLSTELQTSDAALDPRTIRRWAENQVAAKTFQTEFKVPNFGKLKPIHPRWNQRHSLRVLSEIENDTLYFTDPTGYRIAETSVPDFLEDQDSIYYDFVVNLPSLDLRWSDYSTNIDFNSNAD